MEIKRGKKLIDREIIERKIGRQNNLLTGKLIDRKIN